MARDEKGIRSHDGEHGVAGASHAEHGGGKETGEHSGHAGHSVAMFRDRF